MNVNAGEASYQIDHGMFAKSSGLLSSSSTETRTHNSRTDAVGTSLGGAHVLIQSGQDIALKGSSAVADGAVTMARELASKSGGRYTAAQIEEQMRLMGNEAFDAAPNSTEVLTTPEAIAHNIKQDPGMPKTSDGRVVVEIPGQANADIQQFIIGNSTNGANYIPGVSPYVGSRTNGPSASFGTTAPATTTARCANGDLACISGVTLPIRPAVLNSPDYPFSPVNAPVKLDQNESFADFPHELKAIALQRLQDLPWHRYTDLNAEALSTAIAAHDGWTASGTVVTTGSNVLIALLIQLCALGGRVVTVKPNFALYALDAKLLGAALSEVPLRPDMSLDMDAVIAALGGTDGEGPHGVIYIPRPHAPTGSLCALDELERLAQACPGWLLVVDEAYHQFAPDDARELARRHDHVVLLRTFSKAWGLAGVRLGYALASDAVARQLRKLVPPFGVSLLQTVCAQVALEHPGYVQERVAFTLLERERLAAALRAHPTWKALPSHANFLLIRTPDAAAAHADLLAQGVLVRRQDSLHGLQGCIRVTVGTADENSAFLRAAGLGA